MLIVRKFLWNIKQLAPVPVNRKVDRVFVQTQRVEGRCHGTGGFRPGAEVPERTDGPLNANYVIIPPATADKDTSPLPAPNGSAEGGIRFAPFRFEKKHRR